jgi:hypothetical protein
MKAFDWLLFVSHLSGKESAARMRIWRGLRAGGAAILRDGVYLLPESERSRQLLELHATTVRDAGGTAHVLNSRTTDEAEAREFSALFNREEDYAGWHREAAGFTSALPGLDEAAARRAEASLRRALEGITEVDFFPGSSRDSARRVMSELAAAVNSRFSPDEPSATEGDVRVRRLARYQGRVWATRSTQSLLRVASAWLIRRFIDPQARFEWLDSPAACSGDAVGFDFDGAEFSHVGSKVTFEVLMQAFEITTDPVLTRVAAVVHYLDVGGAPVAEAPGVVALLAGARERCPDDSEFLDAASVLLDDLYTSFTTPGGTTS